MNIYNPKKVDICYFFCTKIVKLFLLGIFFLMVSMSSHADEGVIYYGDAKIYGKENIYTKPNPNPSQKIAKKTHKAKSKKIEPVKNEVTEKKLPEETIAPDFPFDSSSLYYSYSSKELAVPVSPQRLYDYQTICKGNHGNTNQRVENSSLFLYLPEQRHKFSTAATQYGILTSFIPNSPPL